MVGISLKMREKIENKVSLHLTEDGLTCGELITVLKPLNLTVCRLAQILASMKKRGLVRISGKRRGRGNTYFNVWSPNTASKPDCAGNGRNE